MNKQYVLTNSAGYFVEGRGFVGTKAQATRLSEDQVASTKACLARAGHSFVEAVEVSVSFAPNYVRPQNRTVTYAYGRTRNTVGADNNNPSNKRFATLAEAQNHAQRAVIANGHVGYWITETTDAVTHYVSTREDPRGLTCPIANA